MTILITNDDGYASPGLAVLSGRLAVDHEVWVVAPDGQRSGCSHAITAGGLPITTREVGERTFACSGYPVDCVNVALDGIIPSRPHLVLSGINLGPNLGTDVLFSGTAGGARQAALKGIPGVALSIFSYRPPFHFGAAVELVAENLEQLRGLCACGTFLNLNFPNREDGELRLKAATLGQVRYRDVRSTYDAPNGRRYHFWTGKMNTDEPDPGSDLAAVLDGWTSVTLVRAEPSSIGTPEVSAFRLPVRRSG